MILKEGSYRNFTETFYHGSMDELNKTNSRFRFFFITNSFRYALRFAVEEENHIQDESVIFKFNFNKEVNIFNARIEEDYNNLKSYLISHNEKYFLDFLPKLKNTDWTILDKSYPYENREKLFDIIINELGYEGFFNVEMTEVDLYNGLKKAPSIGILDIDKLIKIGEIHGHDIENMKEYRELNKEETNEWEELIRKYINDGGLSKKDIINSNIASDIVEELKAGENRFFTIHHDKMVDMVNMFRESLIKSSSFRLREQKIESLNDLLYKVYRDKKQFNIGQLKENIIDFEFISPYTRQRYNIVKSSPNILLECELNNILDSFNPDIYIKYNCTNNYLKEASMNRGKSFSLYNGFPVVFWHEKD